MIIESIYFLRKMSNISAVNTKNELNNNDKSQNINENSSIKNFEIVSKQSNPYVDNEYHNENNQILLNKSLNESITSMDNSILQTPGSLKDKLICDNNNDDNKDIVLFEDCNINTGFDKTQKLNHEDNSLSTQKEDKINNDFLLNPSSSVDNLDIFFDLENDDLINSDNLNSFVADFKSSTHSLYYDLNSNKNDNKFSDNQIIDSKTNNNKSLPRVNSCSRITLDKNLKDFPFSNTDKANNDCIKPNKFDSMDKKSTIINEQQSSMSNTISNDGIESINLKILNNDNNNNNKNDDSKEVLEALDSTNLLIDNADKQSSNVSNIRLDYKSTIVSSMTPVLMAPQITPITIRKRRTNNFLTNMISVPYKQKSLEFYRLFNKNIEKNELLIADFYCAYNAMQGRLYISKNHFAFHCNIMGVFAKKWVWNCSDVVSISKANTALIIPNAIQIVIKQSTLPPITTATTTTNNSNPNLSIFSPADIAPNEGNNNNSINNSTTTATANININNKEIIEQKYLLTSFTQRDKTFALMETVWKRSINNRPLSNQEISDIVFRLYGNDLGFQTEEEHHAFFICHESVESRSEMIESSSSNEILPSKSTSTPPTSSSLMSTTKPINETDSKVNQQQQEKSSLVKNNELPQIQHQQQQQQQSSSLMSSDTVVSDHKNQSNPLEKINVAMDVDEKSIKTNETKNNDNDNNKILESATPVTKSLNRFFQNAQISSVEGSCRCTQHKGTLMVEQILPFPVDYLFELLFVDQSFMRFLHMKRQTTGLKFNSWMTFDGKDQPLVPIPDGDYDLTNGEYRILKYTVKVNGLPLVKSSMVTENQYLLQSDFNRAYCLLSQIKNSGVPYADSFVGSSVWCLNSCLPSNNNNKMNDVDENNDEDNVKLRLKLPTHTKLRIYFTVHYIKSSISLSLMKSSIEKSSIQGFQDFLNDMLQLLQNKRFDYVSRSISFLESSSKLTDDDNISTSSSKKINNKLSLAKTKNSKTFEDFQVEQLEFLDEEDDVEEDDDNDEDDDCIEDDENDDQYKNIENDKSINSDQNSSSATTTTTTTIGLIFATIGFIINYFIGLLFDKIFPFPLTDSKLLKIVVLILIGMFIINIYVLKQFSDIETRLNDMIELIENSKVQTSSSQLS